MSNSSFRIITGCSRFSIVTIYRSVVCWQWICREIQRVCLLDFHTSLISTNVFYALNYTHGVTVLANLLLIKTYSYFPTIYVVVGCLIKSRSVQIIYLYIRVSGYNMCMYIDILFARFDSLTFRFLGCHSCWFELLRYVWGIVALMVLQMTQSVFIERCCHLCAEILIGSAILRASFYKDFRLNGSFDYVIYFCSAVNRRIINNTTITSFFFVWNTYITQYITGMNACFKKYWKIPFHALYPRVFNPPW